MRNLRLTRHDQWLPTPITAVTGNLAGNELLAHVQLRDGSVSSRFALTRRDELVVSVREWLLHVSMASGAIAGAALDGWASWTSVRLADYAMSATAR